MDVFISFRLVDHDGPVGIEQCCSCRLPSKLAVQINAALRVFLGKALDWIDTTVPLREGPPSDPYTHSATHVRRNCTHLPTSAMCTRAREDQV